MHHTYNRPAPSTSAPGHHALAETETHSAAAATAGSSNHNSGAATRARGLSINTMPANIRRSEGARGYSDLSTPPRQRSQHHHQQSPQLPALPPRYRGSFGGSLDDEPYLATSFGAQPQQSPQQQQQQLMSQRPITNVRQSATSASSLAHQQASTLASTSTSTSTSAVAATSTVRTASHGAATATASSASSRDSRCEQIVQNFYSKAAHVVAHLRGGRTAAHATASSRYDQSADIDGSGSAFSPRMLGASSSGHHGAGGLALDASSASSSVVDVGANGRRVNRWFNLNLEDIGEVKEEVRFWRYAVVNAHLPLHTPPPTMFIEVCLDVSRVGAGDELQVTDIFGRPWSVDLDVTASGNSISSSGGGCGRASTIVLEAWRLDLDTRQLPSPAPDLPRVYKQAIVFFRSLYAFASLLPAMSLGRRLQTSGDSLSLFCSFRTEVTPRNGVIDLDASLTGTEKFLESHAFEPVPTPMGLFVMSVQYRRECLFTTTAQHSNPLHGSFGAIAAADDTYFTPTLSSRSGSSFSMPRHTQAQMHTQRHQPTRAPLHQQTMPETHQRGLSIGSDRSLTMPSVNPFRARPLSLGESSSLPGYLAGDGSLPRRASGRASLEWGQQTLQPSAVPDAGTASVSSKTSLRRISLGARGHAHTFLGPHITSSEPVTGFSSAAYDAAHPDHHVALATSSSSSGKAINAARPRSFDQKGSSVAGRLSSSGGGVVDSGSMLHRSVMLRRFGDALSPTEHHKQLDNFTSMSTSATHSASVSASASASASKSPPRPEVGSARSLSSAGSIGSVAGRSTLGFAPFKSPSLSESPKGIAGGPSYIEEMPEEALRSGSSASRRRGYTLSYDTGSGSGTGAGASAGSGEHHHHHHQAPSGGMQQLMTKMSESPSSFGSSGSNSHSRGLSSSFGNRRTSMTRRRPSVLATPAAAASVSAAAATATEGIRGYGADEPSGLARRHTIVEGRTWSVGVAQPAPALAEREMADKQDIGDFIRMVDTKQPLRVYSRKDSSQYRQAGFSAAAASVGRRSATGTMPLSSGATARPRITSANYPHRSSEPLHMYYGVLHEFSGLSQDMQSSVVIAPASVPLESIEMDPAVAGGQSSSPFRTRQAIPNPLKSNERLLIGTSRSANAPGAASSSLSHSIEEADQPETAAAAPAGQTISAVPSDKSHGSDNRESDSNLQHGRSLKQVLDQSAVEQGRGREQGKDDFIKQAESGQSIAALQQAFGGLFIDSQRDHGLAASLGSAAALAPAAPRTHIRSAAPGLDAELERPLPQPVSISYLPSEATRYMTRQQKQQQQQQRQRHQLVRRENEDLDMRINDRETMPPSGSAAFARGKSQPVSYVPELDNAFVPRMTTPQPPIARHQSPVQASMPNAKLRLSPETSTGPLSHRSDFMSNNHQLGALLGIADDAAAAGSRASPRSTPSTPLQQQSTAVLGPGGGRLGRQRAASSMAQKQQQQQNQSADPLRSNFPPLSFIVPRSRVEQIPRPSSSTESSSDIGRNRAHGSTASLLEGSRDYADEDEDLMFQMDASLN
ncbi:autophagy protein 13 [Coemansia sp. RSA 2598]|nr:autophagy protein 13 [Coemansia sp. RSA 2598]